MAIIQDDAATDEARDEVLLHYAEVETPKTYLQIDGWINPADSVDIFVNPHGERLSLTAGYSRELWRGDYGLRIHINPDAQAADVIALLKEAIEWFEGDLGTVQKAGNLLLGTQENPPEF